MSTPLELTSLIGLHIKVAVRVDHSCTNRETARAGNMPDPRGYCALIQASGRV
jgi:hypothetical protein